MSAVVLLGAVALLHTRVPHPHKDEQFFWPVVTFFAEHHLLDVSAWRDYQAPQTPWLFMVLGALERLFGGGLSVARAVSAVSGACVLGLLMAAAGDARGRGLRAVAGLLLFPYFVGTSVFLYTDVFAGLWVVGGLVARSVGRHGFAAVLFALAIATRQTAIAFPAAITMHELIQWMRADRCSLRTSVRWLAPCAACGTLLGWVGLFGGLLPPAFTVVIPVSVLGIRPQHGLYFLSCVGAYFVLVEALLFGGWQALRRAAFYRGTAGLTAVLLLALFLCFPPLGNAARAVESMGFLDIALRTALPDVVRQVVYFLLAWLACVRFLGSRLSLLLLVSNALVLMHGHVAWDKYALVPLMGFWVLRALDGPGPSAAAPGPGPCGVPSQRGGTGPHGALAQLGGIAAAEEGRSACDWRVPPTVCNHCRNLVPMRRFELRT